MSQPEQSAWWQRDSAIAWALILFPPVGLYLMWKHAAWRSRFKWLWTAAVPLVWLVIVASAFGEKPEDDSRIQAPPQPTLALVAEETPTSATIVLVTETPAPPSASGEEEAQEASAAEPPGTGVESSGAPQVATVLGILYVYFFDVSLGDAIYVRTPTGEDVIIDGGDSRSELSAFLDALGETAIDVVFASHAHADHIGGLPRVVLESQVGSVWTNGQTYTTNVYRDLEAAITSSGAAKQVGTPGVTFTVGGVLFTVLAPERIGSNINDNSLVVRMDCEESSFLFTGDAETSSENEMILLGRNLDVDVLKLGHHGSRTSTSMQLILASSPRLAIYQAQPGNQYGHPHQETLDRLGGAGVPVFGTGVAGGTVIVSTACDDQFSVSPHLDGFGDQVGSVEPPVAEATLGPPTQVPPEPTAAVLAPTPLPPTPTPPTPAVRDPAAFLG